MRLLWIGGLATTLAIAAWNPLKGEQVPLASGTEPSSIEPSSTAPSSTAPSSTAPSSTAPRGVDARTDPRVSIIVCRHGDVLVAPVQFGERLIPCWVDTGSTLNLVDEPLRSILGPVWGTTTIKAGGDKLPAYYYRAPTVRLGTIELDSGDTVACQDLSPFRACTGLDIRGILGMEALRHLVVRIDFDQGRLEILKPAGPTRAEWGEPVPLTTDESGLKYFVTVKLAGADRSFRLDTGATMTTVDGALCRELVGRSEMRRVGEGPSTSLAGSRTWPIYSLDRMLVGPFTHEHAVVSEGNQNLLGLSFLSRYRVVFDFPNRKMYLQPGAGRDRPDLINMAGLSVARFEGQTFVTSVLKSGPAERAGLRLGDRLDRVGDREAAYGSLFKLDELFASGDKRQIPITFTRGGGRVQTTVVLSDPTIVPAAATATARPAKTRTPK